MGELVNLRQRRKRQAREEKDQQASRNRILYGRSAAERARQESSNARATARLEEHRLDKTPDKPVK